MKIAASIFKTLFLCLCIIANTHLAYAQTASILPQGKTQFLDNNGKPLTSGTVDFYIPSSTTRKTTWQNSAETIANANPVVLDAGGRAIIYGDGSYRQVVKDRLGNIIWDQVTSSTGSGSGGSTATGDGDLVGTIKPWAGMTAPNQYVFTYGQEISRTTYSALFTAITSSQSIFCTSGSPILTGLSDTTNFPIGGSVEVSCLAAGFSTIISKTSSSITLASNANVSTNTTAIIFPWGRGNGITTFNVPDLRGFAIAGNNNMGGAASSTLTTTYFGSADPNSVGAAGGSQSTSITLVSANLPPYTPAGTITNGAITIVNGTSGAAFATATSTNNIGSGGANGNQALTLTATQAASTFAGTPQGGTSTPIVKSLIQPTKTSNYIIKITPDANSATASGVTSLGSMTGDIACGTGLLCTGNVISSVSGITGPGVSVIGNVALWDNTIGTVLSNSDILATAFSQTSLKGDTIAFKEGANVVGGFGVQSFGASTFVISPNGTDVRIAVSNTSAQLHYDNIVLGTQAAGVVTNWPGITWKIPDYNSVNGGLDHPLLSMGATNVAASVTAGANGPSTGAFALPLWLVTQNSAGAPTTQIAISPTDVPTIGVGTTTPLNDIQASSIQINSSSGVIGSHIHFTNTDTGDTGTDGLYVGINASEQPRIWNYETTDIIFGVNNAQVAAMKSGGVLDVVTGLRINSTATSGNVLRGNGTNFVSAALSSTDLKTAGGAIAIGQSHLPFVIVSSGTMGNNGALTGITAVPAIYASAYCYLPANAIVAGSAAGFYFCQFSSTTAATIFNNTYTSGTPTIPTPTPFVTVGPGAYTQSTGTYLTAYSLTIGANTIGVNGTVRASGLVSSNNTANGKAIRLVFGGTMILGAASAASGTNTAFIGGFSNRGVANSQVALSSAALQYATNGTALSYGAVDTTASQSMIAQIQLSTTATDTLILENIVVEIIPGI